MFDPSIDPVKLGKSTTKSIHSVGAGLLHLLCGMAIHIKGKGCGVMVEVLLHRLHIIAIHR